MYKVGVKIKAKNTEFILKFILNDINKLNETIKTKLRELNCFANYKTIKIKLKRIKNEK